MCSQVRSPPGLSTWPILFLCFINDLKHLNLNVEINIFADDTVIYYAHKDIDVLYDTVQHDLNVVANWCSHSKLCLNAKKTNAFIFSPSF